VYDYGSIPLTVEVDNPRTTYVGDAHIAQYSHYDKTAVCCTAALVTRAICQA